MVAPRFAQQAVEIRHRAELGIYRFVVADVVSEINLRRGIERCYPDGLHSQALEVVEPLRDAVEVADPIAVGILEAAGVDFVDHRVLPPGGPGVGGIDHGCVTSGLDSAGRRGRLRVCRPTVHQADAQTQEGAPTAEWSER